MIVNIYRKYIQNSSDIPSTGIMYYQFSDIYLNYTLVGRGSVDQPHGPVGLDARAALRREDDPLLGPALRTQLAPHRQSCSSRTSKVNVRLKKHMKLIKARIFIDHSEAFLYSKVRSLLFEIYIIYFV